MPICFDEIGGFSPRFFWSHADQTHLGAIVDLHGQGQSSRPGDSVPVDDRLAAKQGREGRLFARPEGPGGDVGRSWDDQISLRHRHGQGESCAAWLMQAGTLASARRRDTRQQTKYSSMPSGKSWRSPSKAFRPRRPNRSPLPSMRTLSAHGPGARRIQTPTASKPALYTLPDRLTGGFHDSRSW